MKNTGRQDTLESEENQRELFRQEYKHKYEKQASADSIKNAEAQKVKDAELALEKAENEQQKQRSYFLYGVIVLALIFGLFIFNRFRITKKQKGIIQEQKLKVDEAFDELEEKNNEIMDSINYAQRIQSAILPSDEVFKEKFPNSFVLYKPKSIVAGDFYWMEVLSKSMEQEQDLVLIAVCDCTGHGVPGAMVSVVCNSELNRSVREFGLKEPGKILDKTRELVVKEFEKSQEDVKDGMDVAVVSIEPKQEGKRTLAPDSYSKLKYSGAHNPLWIIRKDASELEEIKANKQPIGKFDNPVSFQTHEIELHTGDTFYLFTDGYADQFGGNKGKKLKSKNFKDLLLSISYLSMEEQGKRLDEFFENWRADNEQIDDVCVIGVRV
ncbi:MAG: SpoIIE family protein phosphatase [Crocinitomicaceae bacterium]